MNFRYSWPYWVTSQTVKRSPAIISSIGLVLLFSSSVMFLFFGEQVWKTRNTLLEQEFLWPYKRAVLDRILLGSVDLSPDSNPVHVTITGRVKSGRALFVNRNAIAVTLTDHVDILTSGTQVLRLEDVRKYASRNLAKLQKIEIDLKVENEGRYQVFWELKEGWRPNIERLAISINAKYREADRQLVDIGIVLLVAGLLLLLLGCLLWARTAEPKWVHPLMRRWGRR